MRTIATRLRPGKRGAATVGGARLREALVGYAFVLLPMAVFGVFFLYPIGYAIYISFFDWGIYGKIASVGTHNYHYLFHDHVFGLALKNTLFFTFTVVPIQMALGLAMAIVVNQKIRGRAFFRSAFYFPSLTSSAAITAIAIFILNADGLLNKIVGGHTPWFENESTALWSIVGLISWTTSGTMMLFYLAALQSIPTDVYEAAAIDNTGTWRTFWKITFPLLKPAHFFVAVVSVIGAMKVFDQAFIVSHGTGGPNNSTMTMVLYLYRTAIYDVHFGRAAAMGVLLLVIIMAFTLIQRIAFGRPEVQ
ncbi:MAG TPA: sugar ABC transporter permease [Gaiellaceae bacterium]|nr:sugar ABC transporter permease [Gaiellaceae bacterium]